MNRAEYEQLIETINYHMNLYYNLDEPQISDYEYDQLMIALKNAEKENPSWVTSESPTQKIGGVAKREAGVKVTHQVPMLSIEDVFDRESVYQWVNKVKAVHPDCSFSVEIKIDGLSATLRYESGADKKLHLVLCETRGDGYIGEDVTANALVIPDVLQTIDLPYDSLQIRGEVYMSHEDFERYNDMQTMAGKKTAANPRNLAAGTLRQLDPSITASRGLRMFIFNVQQGPEEVMEEHIKGLELLNRKGVPVVYHQKCDTADEVWKTIEKIGKLRGELDYDIDGAVVKINEIPYRNDFSTGSKYSTGHIAYKYPPEERIVVMDEILVDVGRTGKLTFTGVFHDEETGKAARLCGTSVSRATLHNMDYIREMKIGIGGAYKLFKSGEIIPKLNGCVKEPVEIFEQPKLCPVCHSSLVWEADTSDIRCENPGCPAQLSRTIAYFASRDCMNIMGLGDTLVDALIREGYLHDYADIYVLKEHRDELVERGIVGKEKNTDKLLAAIEASKQNSPVQLLTGLAIRNVGRSAAKDLMRAFKSIPKLMDATQEELLAVNDIGQTTADCILDFFENKRNRECIERFSQYGVNMTLSEEQESSHKLDGMTVVVTGTLPTLGRKEAIELIEKNGGKCASSVSKKTSFVLAGEAAGSKLTKATELGIPVLDEKQLLEKLGI